MRNIKWLLVLLVVSIIFYACDSSKSVRMSSQPDDNAANDADIQTDNQDIEDIGDTDISDSSDTGNDGLGNDSDEITRNDSETDDDIVTGDVDVVIPPDCTGDEECSSLDGKCVKGVCSEGKCIKENKPENTVCDDGIFCNGDDACNDSGECVAGDSYPCGDYFCSENSGGMCCDGGFAGSDCTLCVRFVSPAGSGTPDGLSWNTAFGNVADAVTSAGNAVSSGLVSSCEVWIAQGNYTIPSTISMISNVSLKGGFTGISDSSSDDASLTVFDGSTVTMDNIISAINVSFMTIEGVKLYGNANNGSGDNYGGGMYVESSSSLTVKNVFFDSNSAKGQTTNSAGYEAKGGAIAIIESNVAIEDCKFTGNTVENGEDGGVGSSDAGSFGGAVYISAGNVSIMDSVFENNQATQVENGSASGGAVFAYMPVTLAFSGNTFTSNYSENWGGGVRIEGGNVTFSANTFSGNSAGNNGGGVEFNAVTSAAFTGNTFSGNSAETGGGVHISNGSNATFNGDLFSGNEATVVAAGLSVVNSTVQVSNSKFQSNNCKGGTECRGGGIGLDTGAEGTITNSLITKNNAKSYGGGIYTRDDSAISIIFSTIADNTTGTSSSSGSGIHNYDHSDSQVYNSILYGNSPGAEIQNNSSSSATVTYSLVEGGYSGTGNINADPLFADSTNSDYHLTTDSPCIDAAETSDSNPSTDLDSNARPDGTGYDMGCYEF